MRSRRRLADPLEAGAVVRLAARRLGPWLAAAGLTALPAGPLLAAPDLIHIEVEAERAEDGKPIDMEFHEFERTPELSRARVLVGAGGAASAVSIFVLRGFCAVAESRSAKFFYLRPLRGEAASPLGDAVHTAEFADQRAAVTPARLRGAAASGSAADGVYSIDDCRLAGFVR